MRVGQNLLPFDNISVLTRRKESLSLQSIPLLILLFLPGCLSAIIADSGPNFGSLTTRRDVVEKLGEPRLSAHIDSGPFDEYQIRNFSKAGADHMLVFSAVTLGIVDIIALPFVIHDATKSHDVKFLYDDSESVIHYEVDGSLDDYNAHLHHRPFGA